jgi:hypothetical protein
MRTSDRTYSQQLGFQDPDRNDKLHNGCCLYLSQPEKVKKICDGFKFKVEEKIEPQINYPIVTGSRHEDSKYRRIIGYLDLFYYVGFHEGEHHSVAIEVKKGFSDVTSVIQQINTYRFFSKSRGNVLFFLCTMYKIDSLYKNTLLNHGIKHIYVDENDVKSFLENQKIIESERF